VFTPVRIGQLALRNRVIKSATFEGMTPGGVPSAALVEHHRRLAAGGVALTTVAYCAVSRDGRTFADQIAATEAIVPALRELTDAVHREGAAASLQLSHCGFFTRLRAPGGRGPRSASFAWNAYGLSAGVPFARGMPESGIETVVADFGRAAAWAVRAGFDAIELHLGHGYLLSQFLSPATNRRRDRFGGSLDNRLRVPVAVVRRVREEVGPRVAVLAKTNLRDGFRGGLELDEAVEVARRLEAEGVDALVLSGGFTSRTPFFLLRGERPLADMIRVERSRLQRLALRAFGPLLVRAWPFEELFFLPLAREVRKAVRMPLALLGGIVSLDGMETALREGFELVALGRALIADPELVRELERGTKRRTRCTACNACVAEMEDGGIRCVLDGPRSLGAAG
jgi:2,4-dienoyl-CoA reductase-like NADH-dependent reductase (Old Yellow Enzyme family)